MKSQKKLIEKQDWDVLIVLDACRYDFFEEFYERYLSGDLQKVRSEGKATIHWLNNTFDGFMDATYYSGNPFVNSKGIEFYGFKATDHFSRIVDVWDFGWQEEAGTVPPEEMNRAYDGSNPAILHYMQPHRPYLTLDEDSTEGIARQKLQESTTFLQKARSWLANISTSLLGDFRTVKLSEFIRGKENLIGWGSIIREVGAVRVIEAYKENLNIVLEAVSDLIEGISGEVVITTDHGEFFGKDDLWGHGEAGGKEIQEVPWLVVK